ncbi:hypothetical protein PVAG01_08283 [Phlyctema vagabunda]|uniref:Glycosyltransferase 2 n=1 Tax=Phlyctema vagabunda TaxID=108571 RepID=A0ABR4P8Z8_9HELO
MALGSRLFVGDEELGKKDDDHKRGDKGAFGTWQSRRTPHRRSMKRVLIAATTLIVLYYFFKNMPTDLQHPGVRPHYDHPDRTTPPSPPAVHAPIAKPKVSEEHSVETGRTFEGPIKFYKLAASLHGLSDVKGGEAINDNVLFAAASLKSVSTILPIACEMALKKRAYVHFAMIGRDEIAMDILKAVNGVADGCGIYFHDARPDFSIQSTEFRMAVSTSAALSHINNFMHPQVILVDGSGEEEAYFLKGIRERAGLTGTPIIDLPDNTEQSLLWITDLDSASLSAWNKVTFDMVIHAPTQSSGSLVRLLESLKHADYFSSPPPSLTIELPPIIDETTTRYLENYRWPPAKSAPPGSGSQLTIHHRIPQELLKPEESAIRFLEAFWPARLESSHVLVLSPQVELSRLFFHYLKFTTLEYRHSKSQQDSGPKLFGISLDLPTTHLNDSLAFTPPVNPLNDKAPHSSSPFLWQAPNSNAALYFGEKWVELHDFVSHILRAQKTAPTATILSQKLVSKTYPSWLEHMLRLVRARGYWMLYPHFESDNSIATVHSELYHLPEEYSEDPDMHPDPLTEVDGALTADPSHHLSLKHSETSLYSTSLSRVMGGALPAIRDLPLVTWDGDVIPTTEIGNYALTYSKLIRQELGGCDVSKPPKARLGLGASDLFCLDIDKNTIMATEEVPLVAALPLASTSSSHLANIPTSVPVMVEEAR